MQLQFFTQRQNGPEACGSDRVKEHFDLRGNIARVLLFSDDSISPPHCFMLIYNYFVGIYMFFHKHKMNNPLVDEGM